MSTRLMNRGRFLALISPLFLAAAAQAAFVNESFTTDPGWTGVNNTPPPPPPHLISQQNYGYSGATNWAGGAVGEAGGQTGRDPFLSFYGDTTSIVTGMSVNDPMAASGSVNIRVPNPAWNHSFGFGHFRETDPGDFVGLVFSEPSGGYSGSRVRGIIQRDNGANAIASTPLFDVAQGVAHTFSYLWNPTGGITGQGLLTMTIDGITATSETTNFNTGGNNGTFSPGERAVAANPIFPGNLLGNTFNTWGITVPATPLDSSTMQVFIDDVEYSIDAQVPEPATAGIVALGGALCGLGRRRRR